VSTAIKKVKVLDKKTGNTLNLPAIEIGGILFPIQEPGFQKLGKTPNKTELLREAKTRLAPELFTRV
jgi:hypothetical protein